MGALARDRWALAFLGVAAVCLAGALALSFLAPRFHVPDPVSFAVTSGYVAFMLLFLLRVGRAN